MIGRLSIAAILAATALPASAATVTVTQTLDLTQPRENSAPGSFGW